jgi:hypothetical protein
MSRVDELLTALEDVEWRNEDEVKNEIYGNLLRLYEFASKEENKADERVESLLASASSNEEGSYPFDGLGEEWDRRHSSFEEALAYTDALDHLQQAESLNAFAGRMRRGFELHEGWKEDIFEVLRDPDYESPMVDDSAEDISPEAVEEVSNGYEIAVRTAIEPVLEEYDLV